MKQLIITICVFASFIGKAQTLQYDTTFYNGFQNLPARVTLPPTYYSRPSDSFQIIIFWAGQGEYGTDTSKFTVWGPHSYMRYGGWDGGVQLSTYKYYPIIVTLQRLTSGFLQPPYPNTAMEAVINRYRVRKGSVHLMGLSAGAWSINLAATYQPTLGDYSRMRRYKTVTNVQGVPPTDTYGATPPYATRFRYFVTQGGLGSGGKEIGFEQALDGRDVKTIIDTMNATAALSGYYQQTNYGLGGHSDFDKWFGRTAAPIDTFNIFGKRMNVYQWAIRQGDTTMANAASVLVNSGVSDTTELPSTSVTLTGSGTGGTAPYTYAWTRVSGPNTPTITSPTSATTTVTGMIQGVYIFKLTITDNVAGTGSSNVTKTIGISTADVTITSNSPTITLPTSTASLTSTPDVNHGTLTYKWSKLSQPAQTAKKIAFIGSSTTAGYGSPQDSAWVSRLIAYYNSQGLLTGTTWAGNNLGQTSTDVYMGMPTGYTPTGSQSSPLAGHNITAALALNPNIVIVNYPTNAFDYLTITEIMTAFRTIYNTATAAGVVCMITTSQPRPGFSPSEELKLQTVRDSIIAQFGTHVIDFYTPLADGTSTDYELQYYLGDGVHPNSAGHRQLFYAAVAANPYQFFVTTPSVITTSTAQNTTVTAMSAVGAHKF